ncbi:monovalent cation/H(+) antiporter subunit G [Vallitaleaceae bacterium 9-2]
METHQLIGSVLIAIGLIFQLFGIYGLQRYEHFYVRLSSSSLIDSAGLITILIGLIIFSGWSIASLKIGFILFLMLLLNPLSNHILGRGAYMSNYHPERRSKK